MTGKGMGGKGEDGEQGKPPGGGVGGLDVDAVGVAL